MSERGGLFAPTQRSLRRELRGTRSRDRQTIIGRTSCAPELIEEARREFVCLSISSSILLQKQLRPANNNKDLCNSNDS